MKKRRLSYTKKMPANRVSRAAIELLWPGRYDPSHQGGKMVPRGLFEHSALISRKGMLAMFEARYKQAISRRTLYYWLKKHHAVYMWFKLVLQTGHRTISQTDTTHGN